MSADPLAFLIDCHHFFLDRVGKFRFQSGDLGLKFGCVGSRGLGTENFSSSFCGGSTEEIGGIMKMYL